MPDSNLYDDVRLAVKKAHDSRSDEHVQAIMEEVWATLESRVGTIQEKLLNDLQMARQERDHIRAERDALIETLQRVQTAAAKEAPEKPKTTRRRKAKSDVSS